MPRGDQSQVVNVTVACDLPFQVNVTDLLPVMPDGTDREDASRRRATIVVEPRDTVSRAEEFAVAAAIIGPRRFAREISLSQMAGRGDARYLQADLAEAQAVGPYVLSVAVSRPGHEDEAVLLQYGLQIGAAKHNPLSPETLLSNLKHRFRRVLWEMIITGQAPDDVLGRAVGEIARGVLDDSGLPAQLDLEHMSRQADEVLRR